MSLLPRLRVAAVVAATVIVVVGLVVSSVERLNAFLPFWWPRMLSDWFVIVAGVATALYFIATIRMLRTMTRQAESAQQSAEFARETAEITREIFKWSRRSNLQVVDVRLVSDPAREYPVGMDVLVHNFGGGPSPVSELKIGWNRLRPMPHEWNAVALLPDSESDWPIAAIPSDSAALPPIAPGAEFTVRTSHPQIGDFALALGDRRWMVTDDQLYVFGEIGLGGFQDAEIDQFFFTWNAPENRFDPVVVP